MNRFQFLSICFLFVCLNQSVISNPYSFGHINISNGLSHNYILCFAEDNNGFLWIGTRSGLNRYDGYNIKTFKHIQSDSTSLPDNAVQSIVKDQLGRFWIELPNEMCIFNPDNETFTRYFNLICEGNSYSFYNINMVVPYGDSTLFFRVPGVGIIKHNIITNKNILLSHYNDIHSISYDTISHLAVYDQSLYVTHPDGLIEILDANILQVKKRITAIKEIMNTADHDYELFVDNKNNLWLFCNDAALGIYRIDSTDSAKGFNTGSEPALNSNIVSGLIQDSDNNIWIGTDHGGINILNENLKSIEYVTNELYNKNSLSQNVITTLFRSRNSIIWVGTFKQGVNFYHENLFRFFHYVNYPVDKNSLPYNDVNCFAEDRSGNLWIGTNGQGLIYFDRKNKRFFNITAKSDEPDGLQSNVIVALFIDKNNHLWIGTYHGGLSCYDGEKFMNYLHSQKDPTSIKDNKVWDIFEDSHGNLWIGMLGGGLDQFNREKKVFYHYSGTGIHSLNADFVMDITEDEDGNIWFGTDDGVFVLDYSTSRFVHYAHEIDNEGSISDNFIYKVFKDSKGNIWLGTRNGLNLYDKQDNRFIRFNTDNGLADNLIMSILESDFGNLWLGTSNGLSKLVVTYDENNKYLSHYTVNFNESDGLQGREFNEGSALKTSNGELIFGGSNGFNLFRPGNDLTKNKKFITHITGLEIFGNEVNVNRKIADKETIYSSVLGGETIKLHYKENMFSLKFLSIDYLSAKKSITVTN